MSCGIHEFLSYFTNYRAKGSAAFEGNQKLPISSTHPSPSRMHSISREVGIRHLRSVPPQLVKFDKIKTTRCKEKLVIIREIRGSKKNKMLWKIRLRKHWRKWRRSWLRSSPHCSPRWAHTQPFADANGSEKWENEKWKMEPRAPRAQILNDNDKW